MVTSPEQFGADAISSLSPDVRRLIVSKIPLKEALRTAVLSTAWRALWSAGALVKLDLEAREEFEQIVSKFSMHFDSPDRLKLSVNSSDGGGGDVSYDVVVVKGTDCDLHFDFAAGREELQESKEARTKFNLLFDHNWPGISFSSVRILHLRSVGHFAQNLATDLFSSCSSLETLALEKCANLQNIDIKANNALRSLKISDCGNINRISVTAAGLRSFFYRGMLSTILLEAPQLVDATLNFRQGVGHSNFDCEDVLCLLFSLKDVESLTIAGWLLECLCMAGVIFGRLASKFNKLKELRWIDSSMDANKRDSLACFLNNTPVLERLYIQVDKNLTQVTSPYLHECWHEPHLYMDYTEVKSNASKMVNLKIIQFVGFTGTIEEDEILLMDLLLHMAVNLRGMFLVLPEEKETWKVTVTPKTQLRYVVRVNRKLKLIPSPNDYSVFVLTADVPMMSGNVDPSVDF